LGMLQGKVFFWKIVFMEIEIWPKETQSKKNISPHKCI
jgi:hypothetical protein